MNIEELKKRRELYLKAEQTILESSQSYQIGTRNLTRANLAEIRKAIKDLDNQINTAENKGNIRIQRFIPMSDW